MFCASLAGCSAHERRTATAAQSSAGPAIAQAALTTTIPADPDGATIGGAASAAGEQQRAGVKAVVVSAKAPDGATLKIGKSGGGLASWYGDRFHGRQTANGERFDMMSLSAAHPSFPLPSYVRVTNVSNGRSLVVRVNDRGPFHGGRVIDVSRRAADVLGFRSHGVGTVKLDYVGKAPQTSDDQRLLASYQEFGRPSLPPGTQIAALAPVSDADLASENASAGVYAVASRTVTRSAAYVVASASSAASTVRSAAETTTATARIAVRKILPETKTQPAPQTITLASTAPAGAPTAYAPPQPLISTIPAEIAPGASNAKRVVAPSQPALASIAPPLRPSMSASDVSSRISSSFDSFGPRATTVETGASVRAEVSR